MSQTSIDIQVQPDGAHRTSVNGEVVAEVPAPQDQMRAATPQGAHRTVVTITVSDEN